LEDDELLELVAERGRGVGQAGERQQRGRAACRLKVLRIDLGGDDGVGLDPGGAQVVERVQPVAAVVTRAGQAERRPAVGVGEVVEDGVASLAYVSAISIHRAR
jgi:hypothetical protein